MKLINSEKINKNLAIRIIFSLFALLFLVFLGICIYTMVIVPQQISSSIRKEMIEFYAPTAINEEEDAILLTLMEKPNEELLEISYEYFLKNYNLETVFIEKKEKYFVNFFKGKSKFTHLGTVCLKWNEKTINLNLENTNEQVKKTEQEIITTTIPEEEKAPIFKKKYDTKIAVVLDDAGYNYRAADIFYNSQLPLTFALIPDLPNSYEHYKKINNAGMDVILHIPMEPEKGAEYVEKQAILVSMNSEEITDKLNLFFNHYPNAIGMNNHMGSRAVKDSNVIGTVLNFAKKRDIFWLDSKTTPASVSGRIAKEKKVPYLERDVFLDNENTEEYAEKAMIQLIKIAKKRGYAIGIGHVQSDKLYPVLEKYREKQDELEIEFVPLADLFYKFEK
jgi:polysaccharide deacetylase 2 family uncharacterized protein YibQ